MDIPEKRPRKVEHREPIGPSGQRNLEQLTLPGLERASVPNEPADTVKRANPRKRKRSNRKNDLTGPWQLFLPAP